MLDVNRKAIVDIKRQRGPRKSDGAVAETTNPRRGAAGQQSEQSPIQRQYHLSQVPATKSTLVGSIKVPANTCKDQGPSRGQVSRERTKSNGTIKDAEPDFDHRMGDLASGLAVCRGTVGKSGTRRINSRRDRSVRLLDNNMMAMRAKTDVDSDCGSK